MHSSTSESSLSTAFASHASLLFLCAGMPVRIPEVCLAEPAVASFAIPNGGNHARLIPERHALAEYPARLTFFFPWSFLSPHSRLSRRLTLLALPRSHCKEGCPPLLHVLAFAVRTDSAALLMLGECHDFRKLFFASPTQKIVLRHGSLPIAGRPSQAAGPSLHSRQRRVQGTASSRALEMG